MASIKKTTQEIVAEFCQSPLVAEEIVYIESVDSFAQYQKGEGYFKILKRQEMEKFVYLFLVANMKKNLTTSFVKDFINQIKYIMYSREEDVVTDYIGISESKCLNKRSMDFEPYTREMRAFHKINIDPEEEHDPTAFMQFLDEILVKEDGITPDKDLQSLVQEMFGYCLINSIEGHRSFFLVGNGSNGKSVLLSLLMEIIGEQFCDSQSIESLTVDRFAAASLIGKIVNVCTEEESKYVKSDKFKALVSGDQITIQRKYEDSFTWKPNVKFIFATNEMPTFAGFNRGLLRRICIIPFNRHFKENEKDTKKLRKLRGELKAIVWWAMRGAERLIENEFRFTEPAQVEGKKEELKEKLSSAVLFYNENCQPETHKSTKAEMIYDMYKLWCTKRGKQAQQYYNFLKDIELHTGKRVLLKEGNKQYMHITMTRDMFDEYDE